MYKKNYYQYITHNKNKTILHSFKLTDQLIQNRLANMDWKYGGKWINQQLYTPQGQPEKAWNTPAEYPSKESKHDTREFHSNELNLIFSKKVHGQKQACKVCNHRHICLTAPSHYLNQYWLIFSKVLWHSPEGNFIGWHIQSSSITTYTIITEWKVTLNLFSISSLCFSLLSFSPSSRVILASMRSAPDRSSSTWFWSFSMVASWADTTARKRTVKSRSRSHYLSGPSGNIITNHNHIQMGHISPALLLGPLPSCPFFYVPDHCNSFEDWVPVDFIYGNPIFKSVAVTWTKGDRVPGHWAVANDMAVHMPHWCIYPKLWRLTT